MRPVLVRLPLPGGHELALPAYGTLLVVGMLLAVWASRRHGGQLGLERRQALDLGLLLVLAGLVGAHLLHVLLSWEQYFRDDGLAAGLRRALSPWQGGLVYYGGLAGGILALLVWARRKNLPALDALDFVAPLGALGLAATRGGCFLNGCCFGAPTALPWAITYPAGSYPQTRQAFLGLVPAEAPSLPIHPVQLYELLVAALLFFLLWWRFPRRRFPGEVVTSFGVAYGTWRFLAEFLRADGSGWSPEGAGINTFQWMSLGLVAVSLWGRWLAARRSGRQG